MPSPESKLYTELAKSIPKEDLKDERGMLVAIQGGYCGSSVYGAAELHLLWVSADGARIRWAQVWQTFAQQPGAFTANELIFIRDSY
jgi:hypothetical protein